MYTMNENYYGQENICPSPGVGFGDRVSPAFRTTPPSVHHRQFGGVHNLFVRTAPPPAGDARAACSPSSVCSDEEVDLYTLPSLKSARQPSFQTPPPSSARRATPPSSRARPQPWDSQRPPPPGVEQAKVGGSGYGGSSRGFSRPSLQGTPRMVDELQRMQERLQWMQSALSNEVELEDEASEAASTATALARDLEASLLREQSALQAAAGCRAARDAVRRELHESRAEAQSLRRERDALAAGRLDLVRLLEEAQEVNRGLLAGRRAARAAVEELTRANSRLLEAYAEKRSALGKLARQLRDASLHVQGLEAELLFARGAGAEARGEEGESEGELSEDTEASDKEAWAYAENAFRPAPGEGGAGETPAAAAAARDAEELAAMLARLQVHLGGEAGAWGSEEGARSESEDERGEDGRGRVESGKDDAAEVAPAPRPRSASLPRSGSDEEESADEHVSEDTVLRASAFSARVAESLTQGVETLGVDEAEVAREAGVRDVEQLEKTAAASLLQGDARSAAEALTAALEQLQASSSPGPPPPALLRRLLRQRARCLAALQRHLPALADWARAHRGAEALEERQFEAHLRRLWGLGSARLHDEAAWLARHAGTAQTLGLHAEAAALFRRALCLDPARAAARAALARAERAARAEAPADLYAVLGVARTAGGREVRAAFRALALKLHPDKAGPELGADSAARLFALCAEAHAVLGSAERRSAYDAALRWPGGMGLVSMKADIMLILPAPKRVDRGPLAIPHASALFLAHFASSSMDEVKNTFSKLGWGLKKAFQNEPATFRGRGHVLGGAPSGQSASSSGSTPARASTASDRASSANHGIVSPPPSQAQAARVPTPPPAPSSNASSSRASTALKRAPLPAPSTGNTAPPPHSPALQSALDALGRASDAEASAQLLLVVLCNVLKDPGAARYRHVKLSSPRAQAGIVGVPGALELLWACGFVPIADSPALAPEEAVLVEDAPLEPLEAAARCLRELVGRCDRASAPAEAPPASSAAGRASCAAPQHPTWEPACDRRTSVLIPRAAEQSLPAWFFERAGTEIKTAFREAVRKREDSQVLRTRAMRERAESYKGRPVDHSVARVRVRFPEGVFLQGEFRGGEPVAEVMAWVAAALHDPLHTFDLVRPDRLAICASMGSVKKAQLTPSAVLNFQWTGESAALMKTVPALRRDLLVAAQADGTSGV